MSPVESLPVVEPVDPGSVGDLPGVSTALDTQITYLKSVETYWAARLRNGHCIQNQHDEVMIPIKAVMLNLQTVNAGVAEQV